jgi:hypothetical protein
VWKEFLVRLKCRSVHAAAAAAQLYRVPKVQHLVVDEIFHSVAGDFGSIKDAADDDGVVGGIVVSQALARVVGAPCHLRPRHQSVEELGIQVFEDLFQVVMQAFRAMDFLASTHLANQVGLGGDGLASGKFPEAGRMAGIDVFSIELSDQDMKDGVEHIVSGPFHQVGEAHQDESFAQTDGVVEVGKREELDLEAGQRRARTHLPVGVLKENRESGVHRLQIIKNRGEPAGYSRWHGRRRLRCEVGCFSYSPRLSAAGVQLFFGVFSLVAPP